MTTQGYVRHHRHVVHDRPEWIQPPSLACKVIARMYEIKCKLNGLSMVEYEMTTRTAADAVQRLKARYRRVHGVDIQTGAVKPLAVAELVFKYRYDPRGLNGPTREASAACWMAPTVSRKQSRASADMSSHQHARLYARELDYDQHWAKPFAAAARRAAAGKPLDARERHGAPPRLFAGWPFVYARNVLRQDKGQGFEIAADFLTDHHAGEGGRHAWSSFLPWEVVEELPHMLIRLKALGYLSQAGTTWRLTTNGRKIRGQSQGRITRTAALRVVERLSQRVEEINSNASYCYKIDVAVLFGSVLDPERDRVGDVDLAYRLKPRLVDTKRFDAMREAKIASCPPAQARKWYGDLAWPEDEVIQALTSGSRGVLQIRRLDELEHLFETEPKKPAYRVLHGTWTPPRKGRKKRADGQAHA
jgi:hypothetical protein